MTSMTPTVPVPVGRPAPGTGIDAGIGDAAPPAPRRRRQWMVAGPSCPQCAGPLVFGEGCSVCPVCGHSSCSV